MAELSARENTTLLKRFLSKRFGNTKFNVRSKVTSLRISYDLGPDQSTVQSIVNALEHGSFDGMEDIYNYHSTDSITTAGKALNTFNFVFVTQNFPITFEYKLAQMFSDAIKFHNVPDLNALDELHIDFDDRSIAHNWGNLLLKYFKTRHFITNNPDEIELVKCEWADEDYHNEIVFTYKYKGKEYKTSEFPKKGKTTIKPTQTSTSNDDEEQEVEFTSENLMNVQLIDYSEKAFALIGKDTKRLKNLIKEAGGNYNRYLKVNDEKQPGWIFSIKKSKETYELIKKLQSCHH